jgi:hypothetical protein
MTTETVHLAGIFTLSTVLPALLVAAVLLVT